MRKKGKRGDLRRCGGLQETALLAATVTNCFLHHYPQLRVEVQISAPQLALKANLGQKALPPAHTKRPVSEQNVGGRPSDVY